MVRYLALLVLVPLFATAETQFYQCKDANGRPVFSERPCGPDAVQGSVQGPELSGSVESDFSAVTASNKARDTEREIARLDYDVEQLERERDAKIAELTRRAEYANNNLAGAQFMQSLATERQAVTAQYQSKIEAVNEKIRRLTDQLQ